MTALELLSVIAGLAALLILLYLFYDLIKGGIKERIAGKSRNNRDKEPATHTTLTSGTSAGSNFYNLPKAEKSARPKYAVIDFQTTGLSTEQGIESKIIQAAWLILDEDFAVIQNRLSLISQNEQSSYEAYLVHHLHAEKIREYGRSETEVLSELLDDLKETDTLIFHNAHFDLSMLRGTLMRNGNVEASDTIWQKQTFCTMTFFPELSAGITDEKYPTLSALTERLSGEHIPYRRDHDALVAWHNVCLTRYCATEIKRRYPDEFHKHLSPADHLL